MRFCPIINCDSYAKRENENDNFVKCLKGHEFCFKCGKKWHKDKKCENEEEIDKKMDIDKNRDINNNNNYKYKPANNRKIIVEERIEEKIEEKPIEENRNETEQKENK